MKTDILRRTAVLILLALPILLVPASAQESNPGPQKSITGALQPFVDNGTLAGAVTLVADKDKVLSVDTVGFADIAAKLAMRADALFWIASESKPITAAALMMLVDEGKLQLDDPVQRFLPEFRGQWLVVEQNKDQMHLKKPHHPITIREILSHTSGLPFRSVLEQPTLDLLPLKIGAQSYAMTPLLFEPGTKYQYSNAGINTAGRIIEVVSGMPYEDFLQKRLLDPLEMKDTTFWPNEEQVKRLAKSYKPNAAKTGLEEIKIDQLKYPLSDHQRQPMPAGGLFSTAGDVGRFGQMMLNKGVGPNGKRLLSEGAVKEMTKRQTAESIKDSYGLGFSTGAGTFGHGGAYATNLTIDANRGLVTVFMVQHAGFPGNGGQSSGAFQKAATMEFGGAKK